MDNARQDSADIEILNNHKNLITKSSPMPSGVLFNDQNRPDDRQRALKLYQQQMAYNQKKSAIHDQKPISVSQAGALNIKNQELNEARTRRFNLGYYQTAVMRYLSNQLHLEENMLFSDSLFFEPTEVEYRQLHTIISPYLMGKEIAEIENLAQEMENIHGLDEEEAVAKIANKGCEIASILERVFHRLPRKSVQALEQWEEELNLRTLNNEPQAVETMFRKYIPNKYLMEYNQYYQAMLQAINEKNLDKHEENSIKLWNLLKICLRNLTIDEQLGIEYLFNTKPAIHQKIGSSDGWGIVKHLVSFAMKDPFLE